MIQVLQFENKLNHTNMLVLTSLHSQQQCQTEDSEEKYLYKCQSTRQRKCLVLTGYLCYNRNGIKRVAIVYYKSYLKARMNQLVITNL